jgi:hypothetical protein
MQVLEQSGQKHIGLKRVGECQGKISPVNRREILRPDHDSCQDSDSKQHLTLEYVILRSPASTDGTT